MAEPDSAVLKRQQLRGAVQDLRERGLGAAARWAAEQLAGLPTPDPAQSQPQTLPAAADDDLYLLALSLFEAKVCHRHGTLKNYAQYDPSQATLDRTAAHRNIVGQLTRWLQKQTAKQCFCDATRRIWRARNVNSACLRHV